MNVELIKIEPEAAKAKLVAYRKALAAREHSKAAERTNAEWMQIVAGYKAAAKGLPLIELSKAMAAGGWDEQGRPRFAVARADTRRVRCRAVPGMRLEFWNDARRSGLTRWSCELSAMPPRDSRWPQHWNLNAIVPIVPPDVLPRPDLDLSRRVILWEADWQAAPVDPLLLLPIGGDLYAVEACWDLTPLERAVISGRAQ